MIAAVVAVDENNAIGWKGDMLISIPGDLKMFRELTSGHIVMMGRKTYDALPHGPLLNRTNVVITSRAGMQGARVKASNGAEYYIAELNSAKRWLQDEAKACGKHCFVIGGGMIYKELLSYCERVYLTRIHRAFDEADTWFPDIGKMPEWKIASCGEMQYNGETPYQFCIYEKIK